MSNLDFIQPLKDYVEKTTKEFLEHYGLADKFTVIEKKADEALFNKSVSEHFNEFTNGAVDAVAAETGKTALMSACENTSSSAVAIVGLLLNKGADVNAADVLGKTALDYAKNNVKYGDKIVPLLEKAGAVKSAVNTIKNSSATVSEMATAAATAAAIQYATSEEVSTKDLATTAANAAQQTAAAKSTEPKQEEAKEEGGFFSKLFSFFKK